MNNLFLYLLKVSVGTMVLYLCYVLFFSKDTFYLRNRIFLLVLLVISLVAPLLNVSNFIPETSVETLSPFNSVIMSGANIEAPISEKLTSFDYSRAWICLYFSISAIFLLRMVYGIAQTFSIIRKGTLANSCFPKVVLSEVEHSPFSFFPYVVIPRKTFEGADQPEILEHERAHVRQGHTFDLLFSEFLIVFLWINPFIWLIKRTIVLNHEYLADNCSLKKSSNVREYQYKLLNIPIQLINVPFAHNFSSLVKNRIVMINKKPTPNYAVLKNIIILPAAAILLLVFSSNSLPLPHFAQSSSGISGIWKFDHNRSDLGGGTYKWKEQILGITQNSNSMIIETTLKWRFKKESVFTFKYDLDGRETITTIGDKICKTVAIISEDGKTITKTLTLLNSDNSFYSMTEEIYGFDKDGKSLLITSNSRISGCKMHEIEIFNRVQ